MFLLASAIAASVVLPPLLQPSAMVPGRTGICNIGRQRINSTLMYIRRVVPNTITKTVSIFINSAIQSSVELRLRDVAGSLVRHKTILLPKGESVLQLDVADVPKGLYRLSVLGD